MNRAIRFRDTLLELGKAHGNEKLIQIAAKIHEEIIMLGKDLTPEIEKSILQDAADAFK